MDRSSDSLRRCLTNDRLRKIFYRLFRNFIFPRRIVNRITVFKHVTPVAIPTNWISLQIRWSSFGSHHRGKGSLNLVLGLKKFISLIKGWRENSNYSLMNVVERRSVEKDSGKLSAAQFRATVSIETRLEKEERQADWYQRFAIEISPFFPPSSPTELISLCDRFALPIE